MLISCPECELQVSDKALACPHCGYPMKDISENSPPRKKSKRKYQRLPNGFGQITELKNRNLRNRFRVMISDGKTEYGKPIQKMLKPRAYFPTYKEAYEALLEYHKNPYDLGKDLTVEELYNEWFKHYCAHAKVQDSTNAYVTAWNYCDSLKSFRVRDIRPRHIKRVMEEGTRLEGDTEISIPPTVKPRIKMMFNLMLDYAVEYEIVDKNYSRAFQISNEIADSAKENRKSHIAFTDDEMKTLWKNINIPDVDIILIQCYTGMRPQELGEINLSDVHLDENYLIGGIKTAAGKDRIIPIHPNIKALIENKIAQAQSDGCTKLIVSKGLELKTKYRPLSYHKYFLRFKDICAQLNLAPDHKPHDPRKQFITMAKKYKVDEYAIKRIVGHKISDITELVYTERDPNWLYEEICKIP